RRLSFEVVVISSLNVSMMGAARPTYSTGITSGPPAKSNRPDSLDEHPDDRPWIRMTFAEKSGSSLSSLVALITHLRGILLWSKRTANPYAFRLKTESLQSLSPLLP